MSVTSTLVTGATGLVGVHVLRRLVLAGRRPIAMARGTSPGTEEIERLVDLDLVDWWCCDLREQDPALPTWLQRRLVEGPVDVIHAAGAYRLSTDHAQAFATNVDGLANLLDCLERYAQVASFHHVSSITAAGDTRGCIPETSLARPARFRNPYEESKWAAEELLLRRAEWPLRVYRPGIILGHGTSGETAKFDGPYAAFGMMRRWMPFPIPGQGDAPFPLVTVDLVADVLSGGLEHPPEGTEFVHVLDTAPLSVADFSARMTQRIGGHKQILRLPPTLARIAAKLPGFATLTGLEPQAIAYMTADWTFDTGAFEDLCARASIATVRLEEALDALALYYTLAHGREAHLPS